MIKSTLVQRSIADLQTRYPQATVSSTEWTLRIRNRETDEIICNMWTMIAQDPISGIKQRAIALNDFGTSPLLREIVNRISSSLDAVDKAVLVGFDNHVRPSGHEIDTTQMTFAPKVLLYTNKLHITITETISLFSSAYMMIEVVDESLLYRTVFISYGGTDHKSAFKINKYLKSNSVPTWFFHDDALPGQKLHRMMHEGVNKYDRMILVCSANSLSRPGVLNEIERVLEREAREGGSDILMPVTLDDFVFGDWTPNRPDIAEQVRSRVITKLNFGNREQLTKQLAKILQALQKGIR